MHKEWADKWVAALRSGEYAQSKKALYNPEATDADCDCCEAASAGYCCLGVLMDVVSKERPELGSFDGQGLFKAANGLTFTSYPPHTIMAGVLGAKDVNPVLFETEHERVTCSAANDAKGMTFEQIADKIEQNYENM